MEETLITNEDKGEKYNYKLDKRLMDDDEDLQVKKRSPLKQLFMDFLIFGWNSAQVGIAFIVDDASIVINIYFVGNYVNENAAASIGFASNLQLLLSGAIGYAISSGLESMAAQAYGAQNFELLGAYFNKTILIQIIQTTLISILYLLSPYWLYILKVNSEVYNDAVLYLIYTIPSQIAFAYTETLRAQLHAMNIFELQTKLSYFNLFLKISLSYLFIAHLDLGVVGAVLTKNIQEVLTCVLFYIISKQRNYLQQFQRPFNRESLKNMNIFLKNLLANGIIPFLEWSYYALFTIYAGFLTNVLEISAQSLLGTVYGLFACPFFGIQINANTQVGNAIGECNKEKAKKYSVFSVIWYLICIIISWIFFYISIPKFSQTFYKNDSVTDILLDIESIFQYGIIFECYRMVLPGILRGLNRATLASAVSVLCFFLVSHPLALYLAFTKNQGIKGLWTAMLAGSVSLSILQTIVWLSTNLDIQVDNVRKRIESETLL